jgi:hypothetical protein
LEIFVTFFVFTAYKQITKRIMTTAWLVRFGWEGWHLIIRQNNLVSKSKRGNYERVETD